MWERVEIDNKIGADNKGMDQIKGFCVCTSDISLETSSKFKSANCRSLTIISDNGCEIDSKWLLTTKKSICEVNYLVYFLNPSEYILYFFDIWCKL